MCRWLRRSGETCDLLFLLVLNVLAILVAFYPAVVMLALLVCARGGVRLGVNRRTAGCEQSLWRATLGRNTLPYTPLHCSLYVCTVTLRPVPFIRVTGIGDLSGTQIRESEGRKQTVMTETMCTMVTMVSRSILTATNTLLKVRYMYAHMHQCVLQILLLT